MIRILQFKYALKTDGVTSILLDLYENMDPDRIQFDFLVGAAAVPAEIRSRIENRGGRIFSIEEHCPETNKLAYSIHKLAFCFRLMKRGNYQGMHVHTEEAGRAAVLVLARLAGIPVRILHAHNSFAQGGKVTEKKQRLWKSLEPLMVNRYVTCSEEAARWMFPESVVGSGSVVTVNNGIRLEEFRFPGSAAEEWRQKLLEEIQLWRSQTGQRSAEPGPAPFILCTVGRLARQKNYGFLLELMGMLLKKRKAEASGAGAFVLIFLGDGPERAALEAEANRLGLEDRVFFLGSKSNVKEYLWTSDLFLLPSHFEGLPLVLVEAQAAGLPCLVSDKVTRQVELTSQIQYLPIEGEPSLEAWQQAVEERYRNWKSGEMPDRSRAADQVREAGFDVKTVAKKLQRLYETWASQAGRRERRK